MGPITQNLLDRPPVNSAQHAPQMSPQDPASLARESRPLALAVEFARCMQALKVKFQADPAAGRATAQSTKSRRKEARLDDAAEALGGSAKKFVNCTSRPLGVVPRCQKPLAPRAPSDPKAENKRSPTPAPNRMIYPAMRRTPVTSCTDPETRTRFHVTPPGTSHAVPI